MNLVNISTALHRLAKLTASAPEAQAALRQHPLLTGLLLAADVALDRAALGRALPQCQAFSNIVWALATLQCVDLVLLQKVNALALRQASAFKPFELTTILWAFAKLSQVEPTACQCAEPLFQYAAGYIPGHAHEFTFRCLVMTVWALATAGQHDSKLFHSIARQMTCNIRTASCQELPNSAWAFSTAGVVDDQLFTELAQRAIQQIGAFKPHELSCMLWSFANCNFLHESFFDIAAAAAQRLDLESRQVANVLWALSRVRPQHLTTRVAVLTFLPRCTQTLETFRTEELAAVALAAAKAFGDSVGEVPKVSSPTTFRPPMPPQVATFFAAALPWVLPRLPEFSGQSLASILASFSQAHMDDDTGMYSELLIAIGHRLEDHVKTLDSSALLLLLRDLAGAQQGACDAAVGVLFRETSQRVDALPPSDLQFLSHLCAGLLGCSSVLLTRDMLRNCCLSLAERAAATATSISATVTSVSRKEDTSSTSAGSGNSDADDEDEDEEAEGSHPATGAPKGRHGLPDFGLKYSVKNGFVHFSDGSDGSDISDSEPEFELPPPLDFLPAKVSLEKLQRFRVNYQRFRAGNANGAKGEITSTLPVVSSWPGGSLSDA